MIVTCWTCSREFTSVRARQQHMDALGHSSPEYDCDRCTAVFYTRRAVVDHMSAKNHWAFECNLCYKTWPSAKDQKYHEIEYHYYCAECDREFTQYNNIKMHLNSRIHRGDDIQCPFCDRKYATATGLSHHLESGSCPRAPSLDRDAVYRIVRYKDPSGLISKKLIGWNGSPQYVATAEAWNGYAYECYLCHRTFGKLDSLNQHLGSPTHQQNLYHCPSHVSCGREFSTLAALMNHLESESCGYTRFENVQSSVKDLVSSDRLISFY